MNKFVLQNPEKLPHLCHGYDSDDLFRNGVGTAIALKQRYDKMVHFQETFTYQVVSSHEMDMEEMEEGISKENKVEYKAEASYLLLDPSMFHTKYVNSTYAIILSLK